MPVPTIFLIDNQNQILEMSDQPYDTEAVLQELLARFPSVLAGDQMSGNVPLKWLLVSREAGIPGEEGGTGRFSLDHVFIDQDGMPTFVEVKRSSNTQIRREVVGQMLDYAANAVLYWPVDTIRDLFEKTSEKPDEVIAKFVGCADVVNEETAINGFWDNVETNLRAGKIRLIFAADEIPPELRRIVEFLSEQMNPAEVFAIEIRQYVGPGVRTLVPSLIGSSKRNMGTTRLTVQWDRDSFMQDLTKRWGLGVAGVADAIFRWASNNGVNFGWGSGKVDGSCQMRIEHEGQSYSPFAILTNRFISFQFPALQERSVPVELLKEWVSRLNEIPGVHLPTEVLKYPSFEMALLKEPKALSQFFETVEWFIRRIKMVPTDASHTFVAV